MCHFFFCLSLSLDIQSRLRSADEDKQEDLAG